MPDTPADPTEPVASLEKEPRFTRGQLAAAGAAVGVGSAALVAALLYTKRPRRPAKPPSREQFTD